MFCLTSLKKKKTKKFEHHKCIGGRKKISTAVKTYLTKFIRKTAGYVERVKRVGTLNVNKQFFKFRNVHSREVALNKFCGNDYFKPHIDYELIHGDSYSK